MTHWTLLAPLMNDDTPLAPSSARPSSSIGYALSPPTSSRSFSSSPPSSSRSYPGFAPSNASGASTSTTAATTPVSASPRVPFAPSSSFSPSHPSSAPPSSQRPAPSSYDWNLNDHVLHLLPDRANLGAGFSAGAQNREEIKSSASLYFQQNMPESASYHNAMSHHHSRHVANSSYFSFSTSCSHHAHEEAIGEDLSGNVGVCRSIRLPHPSLFSFQAPASLDAYSTGGVAMAVAAPITSALPAAPSWTHCGWESTSSFSSAIPAPKAIGTSCLSCSCSSGPTTPSSMHSSHLHPHHMSYEASIDALRTEQNAQLDSLANPEHSCHLDVSSDCGGVCREGGASEYFGCVCSTAISASGATSEELSTSSSSFSPRSPLSHHEPCSTPQDHCSAHHHNANCASCEHSMSGASEEVFEFADGLAGCTSSSNSAHSDHNEDHEASKTRSDIPVAEDDSISRIRSLSRPPLPLTPFSLPLHQLSSGSGSQGSTGTNNTTNRTSNTDHSRHEEDGNSNSEPNHPGDTHYGGNYGSNQGDDEDEEKGGRAHRGEDMGRGTNFRLLPRSNPLPAIDENDSIESLVSKLEFSVTFYRGSALMRREDVSKHFGKTAAALAEHIIYTRRADMEYASIPLLQRYIDSLCLLSDWYCLQNRYAAIVGLLLMARHLAVDADLATHCPLTASRLYMELILWSRDAEQRDCYTDLAHNDQPEAVAADWMLQFAYVQSVVQSEPPTVDEERQLWQTCFGYLDSVHTMAHLLDRFSTPDPAANAYHKIIVGLLRAEMALRLGKHEIAVKQVLYFQKLLSTLSDYDTLVIVELIRDYCKRTELVSSSLTLADGRVVKLTDFLISQLATIPTMPLPPLPLLAKTARV